MNWSYWHLRLYTKIQLSIRTYMKKGRFIRTYGVIKMKIFKRTMLGTKSNNELYTQMMEQMLIGKETISIKRVSGISGPKAERDESIALARAMGRSLSERGDLTFIFSCDFVSANVKDFESLLRRINRNCAYQLREIQKDLDESILEQGKLIAIYNEAFLTLKSLLIETALEPSEIREKMRAYGYAVDATLKYEADLKIGGKRKSRPVEDEKVWKSKIINGENWFVTTADTIGSKAIPIITDNSRETALNYMEELQNKYDFVMKRWSEGNRDEISLFKAILEIWDNDTPVADIITHTLSDEDIERSKFIANDIYNKIQIKG